MWRSHSTVELAQLAQHCRPAQQRPHYLQQTHSVRRVFCEALKTKGKLCLNFLFENKPVLCSVNGEVLTAF